jgi:hypothetical protein
MWADERTAIVTHFQTQWNDLDWNDVDGVQGDGVLVVYDNVKYDPHPRQGDDPWITFSIREAGARQASRGNLPIHRHAGAILVQVFTRSGTGTSLPNLIADRVAEIMRNQQIRFEGSGWIRTRTPHKVTSSGKNDPAGWYMVNVNTPYERDFVPSEVTQ